MRKLLPKRVGIVVINWNRPQDTLECLNSLLPWVCQGRASIICCDNGSGDDSLQVLARWAEDHFRATEPCLPKLSSAPPDFLLLSTGKNLGYAGGNNAAIYYILQSWKFEYIWILNNDTVAEANALESLLAAADAHPDIGLLGSTIVHYGDPETLECAGGCRYLPALTLMWKVMGGLPRYRLAELKKAPRLDYIMGAALFLRTEVLRKVGLLNEDYFLYYEELDYVRRLQRAGYEIGWCRESVVQHKGGVSTGGGTRQGGSWTANYYENLSTLMFTAKYHFWWLPVAATFRLLMKLVMILATRRWSVLAPIGQAYRDFFFGHKSTDRSAKAKSEIHYCGYFREGSESAETE